MTMGTILIAVLLISLTCWFKRNEWFRASNTIIRHTTTPSATTTTASPSIPPVAPTTGNGHTAPAPAARWGFFGTIWRILATVLVLALVLGVGSCSYRIYRWATAPPAPKPATTPPAPAPTTPQHGLCRGPWEVREMEIPRGGLPVYLCWGWTSWADGPVTMTTPDGKVFHDAPGHRKNPVDFRDGVGIFRAEPAGSNRRVYIKNRW